jgi:hypothetical protein
LIIECKINIAYPIDNHIAIAYNKVKIEKEGNMARYDPLRKLERNAGVKKYKQEHPELSYREIGEYFNLDASRVFRIVNDNKSKTKRNTRGKQCPL